MSEVLAIADLARYINGWPTPGDFGFVAEDDAPVGAAWWRHFSASDPGFGFIDGRSPEISIGVLPDARGVGVGTLLLGALVAAAREQMLPALSLSVEVENEARRLYQRWRRRVRIEAQDLAALQAVVNPEQAGPHADQRASEVLALLVLTIVERRGLSDKLLGERVGSHVQRRNSVRESVQRGDQRSHAAARTGRNTAVFRNFGQRLYCGRSTSNRSSSAPTIAVYG